ncbi:MAG: PAS domain S-box protein [Candidatus Zixiibacteriota bacterium]
MTEHREIDILRESEEKYRKMIEMANDAIFTIDTVCGRIIDANPKALELTGRTLDELRGMQLWEIHPPEEHELARSLFRSVLETGQGRISRLNCRHTDGRMIPVEVSASIITYGNKKVIQRICRDISDRVALEKRESELHEVLGSVFDTIPVGIGVRTNLNTTPVVLFENKQLRDMFPESDSRNRMGWCGCQDSLQLESRELMGSAGLYGIEKRLPDGRVFFFRANYFRMQHNQWFELVVIEDVTLRRRMEEELRQANEELESRVAIRTRELEKKQAQLVQAEKMASLGNLVAGVAHEINTPLGALKSNNDLFIRSIRKLKTELESCGKVELKNNISIDTLFDNIEQLNSVNETAAHRIIDIVNSLRNFARLDQAEKDLVDIHEGLDNTLTLVHHRLKNRIDVIKQYGSLPKIHCYPNQLNQVFMNLLVNASQAIEGPGTIRIKTEAIEKSIIIAISDTGKGISPEIKTRIFDPGFTTKGAGVGTGLGLSIVLQIIESHQGSIEVASEVGKGTTFKITLPIE